MNRKYKERKRQQFKDEKFLNELGKEMREQDNDYQAAPRFWVLMDSKWTLVPEGYGSDIQIHDGEDGLTETDFKELVKECYEEDMIIEGSEPIDYDGDLWDLVDKVNTHLDSSEFEIFHVVKEKFIVPNTMFLTKAEAKEHIRLNHYHYTEEVHTYAMTAWRAPKVSKLLSALERRGV